MPARPRRLLATLPVAWAALAFATATGSFGCRRPHLPPRPDGAAVGVASEAGEPGVTVLEEVEPNDLIANAQGLAPMPAAAIAVAGHLLAPPGVKAKDVDLYRVTIAPPPVVTEGADGAPPSTRQRLAVEVRPGEGTAVAVDVLDDQGQILVAAGGAAVGEITGIPNLTVIPGSIFVRVKPGSAGAAAGAAPGASSGTTAGSSGSAATNTGAAGTRRDAGVAGDSAYRLTVRVLPFEAGDEVEPNGKAALAVDVAANSEVAGFFGWRHDEDWFRLPLAGLVEGSVVSLDLDPPAGVSASIAVYDSVEHKLTEQKGRKGDRVAIRNVRLPSADPYVFVVARAEAGLNIEARYALRLRVEEARSDAELEPNDDAAHAVPIGDGAFVGFLGPGDVDVYRYSSAMPVELDFEATPPDHIDLKIEQIRDDGSAIFKVDVGKRREAERVANLFVSGSVLLRLSAGKGDGNLDEPYRLRVGSRPVEAGAEHEFNGTAALATPLALGAIGSGLLFPKGDVDFWDVPVPPGIATGSAGTIAVAVRGVAGLSLEVRVHTAAGKEIGRFRVGGDSSAPTRVTPGEGACCQVQIREASGRAANPRDRYTLTVTP